MNWKIKPAPRFQRKIKPQDEELVDRLEFKRDLFRLRRDFKLTISLSGAKLTFFRM